MKRKHINLFFVILFVMTSLTSCLSDGDETIALENGKARELITRTNWRIKEWRGNPPSGLGWKIDDIFKFENNGTFTKWPSDEKNHNWHWIVNSKDSDTPIGISIDSYEFSWDTWGPGLWVLFYPRTNPENPSWIINLDGIGNSDGKENEKPSNTGKYTAVDLGLSVKWATCNVGAKLPEDNGDYYAWGEVETKTSFSWNNYKWVDMAAQGFTKYCITSSSGKIDKRTILELEDDVAHVKWKGDWRMPTYKEWEELCNTKNCNWKWTTQNGKAGFHIISNKNGNSIFLPAAGYYDEGHLYNDYNDIYYWSSSLDEAVQNESARAYGYWRSKNESTLHWRDGIRYDGKTVRPVCP